MRENKFRVYYEYEADGEIHKGIESEASWFLLTQSGELLQYGPLSPLRDCKEYKKLIPIFYTGLKDKNGKKVYAGDIVKNGKGIIYEVRWYNYGFHFDTPKINGKWTSYALEIYEHLHWSGPSVSPGTEEPKHYKDWHIEIIGNIYEHKHLLEEF